MKKFNKLIALLLALIMLVSTAVACNGDTPADTTGSTVVDTTTPDTSNSSDTTASGEVTPPEPEFVTPETITIKKEGSSLNYVITRPEGTTATASGEINAAQQLSAYFEERIGVTPTTDTDWAKEEDSEKLEIIVGATDHPETAALINDMPSYGDYAVRAIGNKIIIVSFDDGGYTKALRHIKTVLARGYDESTKTITVNTANLAKTENVNKQLAALPIYEGGSYLATYDAGRVTATTECDEVIITDTTVAAYDNYLQKLVASGYTKYTTNDIGNNKFAIYTNDEYTLNVGYYDNDKSARLFVEPKGALPTRAEDNDASKKVTTSQITMLAVSKGNSVNGLSTLIRLEDGRFIMVDGAFGGEVYTHWEKTIKEQAKEYTDKPVIAAWIITHGHGDHIGLINGHYNDIKRSGITVERMLINESSEAFVSNVGYGNGNTEKVIGTIAHTLGAELCKPHIGQTFYLSNCKMDILYTQEGQAPTPPNAYNATSIVAKMTFNEGEEGKEETYLSTGDSTGISMQTASEIFGEYMKCNIISLPHHGGNPNGENSQLAAAYKFVLASLILVPVGDRDLSNAVQQSYNKVLLDSDYYKEIYYAGDRGGSDVVVPLPYIPVKGHVYRVPH